MSDTHFHAGDCLGWDRHEPGTPCPFIVPASMSYEQALRRLTERMPDCDDPRPTRPSSVVSTCEGSEFFAWGVVVVTFVILGAAIVTLVMA